MAKGPSTFRKNDIKRGVQALESAGIKVARVEVQPGKIIFVPQSSATDKPAAENETEIVL
jgi:hypothetical protein